MAYEQDGPSRQPISPTIDDAILPLLMIACSGVTTYDSYWIIENHVQFRQALFY